MVKGIEISAYKDKLGERESSQNKFRRDTSRGTLDHTHTIQTLICYSTILLYIYMMQKMLTILPHRGWWYMAHIMPTVSPLLRHGRLATRRRLSPEILEKEELLIFDTIFCAQDVFTFKYVQVQVRQTKISCASIFSLVQYVCDISSAI